MPNTKSAKKALRQSLKHRTRNLTWKRQTKSTAKQYKRFIDGGNLEEAQKQLALAYKTLDKSAKVGVIKKNKASRVKSRLALRLVKPTTKT